MPSGPGSTGFEDEAQEPPFKTLSAHEARVWREANPPVSPWRVIAVQAAVGLVMSLLCWLVVGRGVAAWSALAGAAVVVLPGALMVRGLSRLTGDSPAARLAGFWVWEASKILLALAMLLGLATGVRNLHWPAMLVTLIACLQVHGWALLWRGSKRHNG